MTAQQECRTFLVSTTAGTLRKLRRGPRRQRRFRPIAHGSGLARYPIEMNAPLPLAALLLGAGLLLAPGVGYAQAPAAPASQVGRLEAETGRLRSELDRAHAEIAALKRERGVR